jgi:hypothetical protein
MQERKQYIETEYMTLWLEDGIMNVIFKGATISLEMAKQVVEHRLLLSQKKVYPLYVDIRNIIYIDAKTREFLSGEEGTCQASAAALHINNPVTKLLGNVFIATDNPIRPAELFTDKTKAMEWLAGFKQ